MVQSSPIITLHSIAYVSFVRRAAASYFFSCVVSRSAWVETRSYFVWQGAQCFCKGGLGSSALPPLQKCQQRPKTEKIRVSKGALVRPPNDPTRTGLHPVTPLGYGPRSGRFVPLTRCARGAAQIYSRGNISCRVWEKGRLPVSCCPQ